MLARRFCGSSVGRKIIMAISGGCLGLFLVVHVVGNSSIFFGADAFNNYAAHLHKFDFVLKGAELGLLLIFVIHIAFGTYLFFTNGKARPTGYVVNRANGGRTIGSQTMFYTGLVVFSFILFHVIKIHFADHSQAISVIMRGELQNNMISGFYIAALLALGLHLSHGFWSLLQSLGISHPRYDNSLRFFSVAGALSIAVIFIAIPLLALCWQGFLS